MEAQRSYNGPGNQQAAKKIGRRIGLTVQSFLPFGYPLADRPVVSTGNLSHLYANMRSGRIRAPAGHPKASNQTYDTMQISKHKVVGIHYTLRDNAGQVLDSSEGRDPLYYLHGEGNLIPGMENGLEGHQTGDEFQLTVAPEDGYGERDPELIQEVPRSAFGNNDVQVGMQFHANHGQVVTVTGVSGDQVTIDANHPLAGVELQFDVQVVEVRDATSEEVAHGHVHGPGGHQH